MCNERYEERHRKLWGMYTDDYSKGNPISFFVKKDRAQLHDITGKVYTPNEFKQDIKYDAKVAFDLLVERLYTKKLTKGMRITPRQSFLEEMKKSTYDWAGLIHYLRQAYSENSKWVLLSRKEVAMLQPRLTKRQERDRRLEKKLIQY